MNRREFNRYMGAAAAIPAALSTPVIAATDTSWSVIADIAESCSCEIPCPCNFGRPTDLCCEGSRLIQINSGNIDGLDLAGIAFVVSFEMGKWTKIYLEESLSDAQVEAFNQVLPTAFKGFKKLMQSMHRAPISVERTADQVHFSVPESTVEIAVIRDLDGKPITIDNLPSPVFHNYTQYESLAHRHQSSHAEFSYTGTNGFTSKMIASG